jgi:hypothetical protein
LKWAAVQDDWSSIRYIPDASEELKLAAVKRSGLAIQYISNPSEELKMAAVKIKDQPSDIFLIRLRS